MPPPEPIDLIVEADSGLLLLGIRPFRKDGIRKRGAGAGNIRSCLGRTADEHGGALRKRRGLASF